MGTVANLAVRISANAQDFEKGVAGVEAQMTGLSGAIKGIGAGLLAAFSLNAIDSAIGKIGDWGGTIVDFSNRLGLSADSVQRFKFAAEQGGSSINSIARAMELMNRHIAGGDEGFASVLDKIGVSFARIKNQTPDQQFLTIARALNEVEDPALRDAYAFELFGKSGQELQQILPTIIDDLRRAPTAADGAAESADRLGDSWDRLKESALNLGSSSGVLGGLAAAFEYLSDRINGSKEAYANLFTTGSFAGDMHLPDVTKIAEAGALGINDLQRGFSIDQVTGFTKVTGELGLSMSELNKMEREYEANLKKTNRAREDAVRAANKQEAAYRSMMNSVGEKQMQAEFDLMEQQRKDAVDAFNQESGLDSQAATLQARYDEESRLDAQHRQLMNELGEKQMQADADALNARGQMWRDFYASITASTSYAFASMLTGMTSFKDGFISIWHSIQQSLTNILADLLNNVVGGFIKGIGTMLSGGNFSAGGLGSLFGNLFGGGGSRSTSIMGGAAAGGGGGMGGLGAFFTNPWTIGIGAVGGLLGGIFGGGLFRGGEEGTKVNPARDAFFRDFQDQYGGGQAEALHKAFADQAPQISAEFADNLTKRLFEADTMAEFEAATAAINEQLAIGAEQSKVDAANLQTSTATSTLAIDTLVASINSLVPAITSLVAQLASAGSILTASAAAIPVLAGATATGIIDPNSVSLSDVVEIPGFASGSGGFQNFGAGTLAMLHGTEAVVRPEDLRGRGGPTVNIRGGTIIGSSQEFEHAVGRAFNAALERGGKTRSQFRRVTGAG